MLKVAPIIHTRTYNCDFNSEFMVRPVDFKDSDIRWARKEVLSATNSIDNLNGERWVVADNGFKRIAGIVIFIKDLASRCALNENKKKEAEKYFFDNKGRSIYAFIGVAINSTVSDGGLEISYDYLWELYIQHVMPKWNRTLIETSLCDYILCNTIKKANTLDIKPEYINGMEFYEANAITDKLLFDFYLMDHTQKVKSFCSNISSIKVIKEGCFSVVTTSANVITRLKRELLKTDNALVSNVNDSNAIKQANAIIPNGKKKISMEWMLYLMIFAVIIILLLLKLMKWS